MPPEERHRPDVDRDLDIYEIDLTSGARRPLIATPAEEFAPVVAGKHLYWTHTEIETDVIVLPDSGGPVRVIAHAAMHPSWRPDGGALGVFYGGFRAADWVLTWEGGVVAWPGERRPRTDVRRDFTH